MTLKRSSRSALKRQIAAVLAIVLAASMAALPSAVYADAPKDAQTTDQNQEQTAPDTPKTDDAERTGEWVTTDEGKSYQYDDGTYAKGLTEIDGNKYYFDSEHKMVTGWQKIDDKKHYFKSSGKMATGLTTINGSKYYFSSKGVMATGLTKISGSKYYFSTNGKMYSGFKKISGKQYYFQKSGKMFLKGKKTIGNKMCYFDSKGVLTRSIDKTKPIVALTYDDGPSPNTKTILSTLKKYNGVATFFVVGERVKAYSSTIKKAYSMGCEIGNHTYNHKNLTRLSASGMRSQINKTNKAVKKVIGRSPVVVRPPEGAHNASVRRTIKAPMILWSIDTRDWEHRNASKTISAVLNHVRDGDIVLMHDLYAPTAKASKTIIPRLVKRGYQLVTMSELADCRGGIKNGKAYYSLRR